MPRVVLAGEAELTDLLKTLTGDGGVDGEDEGSEGRAANEREEVVNLSDSGSEKEEVMVLSDKAVEEVDAAVPHEVRTLASNDLGEQSGEHTHDPANSRVRFQGCDFKGRLKWRRAVVGWGHMPQDADAARHRRRSRARSRSPTTSTPRSPTRQQMAPSARRPSSTRSWST